MAILCSQRQLAKHSLPHVVLATTSGGTDSYYKFIALSCLKFCSQIHPKVHVSTEKQVHTVLTVL